MSRPTHTMGGADDEYFTAVAGLDATARALVAMGYNKGRADLLLQEADLDRLEKTRLLRVKEQEVDALRAKLRDTEQRLETALQYQAAAKIYCAARLRRLESKTAEDIAEHGTAEHVTRDALMDVYRNDDTIPF